VAIVGDANPTVVGIGDVLDDREAEFRPAVAPGGATLGAVITLVGGDARAVVVGEQPDADRDGRRRFLAPVTLLDRSPRRLWARGALLSGITGTRSVLVAYRAMLHGVVKAVLEQLLEAAPVGVGGAVGRDCQRRVADVDDVPDSTGDSNERNIPDISAYVVSRAPRTASVRSVNSVASSANSFSIGSLPTLP
jgi:hypothetical protein